MPAFYVFVAVGALLVVATRGGQQRQDFFENALTSLLYVNNYFRITHPEVSAWFGHAWSLSLEEQFYLVWPLCMLVLSRTPAQRARLPLVLSGLVLALVGWRLSLVALGSSEARIHFSLDTRCDELVIGCALAAWRYVGFVFVPRPEAAAAESKLVLALVRCGPLALVLLLVSMFLPLAHEGQVGVMAWGGYTVSALLTAVVVLSLDQGYGRFRTLLSSRPLTELGRISYGFYLWHYPVTAVANAQLVKRIGLAPALLVACLVSYGLAQASYRLVEQPFQRLRARNTAKPAVADLAISVNRVSNADL